MRYRGHVITLTRSTLCGFAAWKYELTEAGTPAGYGYHTGDRASVVRFAKHQIEQRLAAIGESAMKGAQECRTGNP